MKVALAQLNPVIGDLEGNLAKIRSALEEATRAGADLVVTPELSLTGYPPRDLLDLDDFIQANLEALQRLAGESRETGLLVGFVDRNETPDGPKLFNSAALLRRGGVLSTHHKTLLPTYDVFDEDRYFEPASCVDVVAFGGQTLGISICEDIWNDPEFRSRRRYDDDPIATLVAKGATLLLNLSASPYVLGKTGVRARMLANQVRRHHLPLVYVNQVGGNDELIFDGNSMALDASGRLVKLCRGFAEDLQVVDLDRLGDSEAVEPTDDVSALNQALTLGTRDYVHKSGFTDVVLGLSGGIDSAVVACIAVEALGAGHVRALSMPGPYSSAHSIADAKTLASALGIRLDIVNITPMYQSYLDNLKPLFEGRAPDVTEENIQARIRGNTLMSVSNKLRCLVMVTGNKSEMAVGYCTLYGDMAGSLAIISDVPKTQVYELARHINSRRPVIPISTLTKPPSAELKPDQTDQDSLPPYDVLDAILHGHIEEHCSTEDLVSRGFDRNVVEDVVVPGTMPGHVARVGADFQDKGPSAGQNVGVHSPEGPVEYVALDNTTVFKRSSRFTLNVAVSAQQAAVLLEPSVDRVSL